MALILSIETATDVCSAALHEKGELINHQVHKVEKSHSTLLPRIVLEICKQANTTLQTINAVAVSAGPGSYTGLRIGVSTVKGFAYTLNIPIIAIPTMDVILEAVRGRFKGEFLLCAMTDARRMEVYTKMEDQDGIEIWGVHPKILNAESFAEFVKPIYLFGNG
ncbi:MAG: tRNA (adenosine(37)-N6)-threonylcarbamoyltransferase complex dimerization subunit type 1 TsaB, partial [Ekhidna sp.]|nr:tRNA (adenosine(37)-N6)-threonylcarbamoyltransferase complex dimerization subunit type 1 TsaB [Ekhidna sp.]